MTLKEKIEHFENERDRVKANFEREIAPIQQQLVALKLQFIEQEYGAAIGRIVTYRGNIYRICDIEANWYSSISRRPWVKGNPKRKDGSFGTAERNLFSYWALANDLPQGTRPESINSR